MLPPNNNKSNQPEKTFNSLDWTAGAATALPTALSLYAFNAASKAETTPGMLFHTAIGLLSCKYAYGFASSWKENKDTTTKEQYFAKAFYNAENIQKDATGKVSSLFSSIISPSKNAKFQDIGKKVIEESKQVSLQTADLTIVAQLFAPRTECEKEKAPHSPTVIAAKSLPDTSHSLNSSQIPKVDSWDTLNDGNEHH